MKARTAIIGIGNTLLGDDGIGIYVCEALERSLSAWADFIQTEEMGLSLLDFISGYDRVILIDCIDTGTKEPGSIHVIPIDNFYNAPYRSNHYVGLPEVASIAREMKVPFPQEVVVIGIEVEDPYTIRETLSAPIKKKWKGIVELVGQRICQILAQKSRAHA